MACRTTWPRLRDEPFRRIHPTSRAPWTRGLSSLSSRSRATGYRQRPQLILPGCHSPAKLYRDFGPGVGCLSKTPRRMKPSTDTGFSALYAEFQGTRDENAMLAGYRDGEPQSTGRMQNSVWTVDTCVGQLVHASLAELYRHTSRHPVAARKPLTATGQDPVFYHMRLAWEQPLRLSRARHHMWASIGLGLTTRTGATRGDLRDFADETSWTRTCSALGH